MPKLVLRSSTFKAMGAPCNIQLYLPENVDTQSVFKPVQAEIQRLEVKYSRYIADSIVGEINSHGFGQPIEVDEETAGLFNYAQVLFEQSNGKFDITSGILRKAWDFKRQELPDQQAIDALLPHIGWHKVSWQAPFIRLPTAQMQIDLGGFVKEYAADRAAIVAQALGCQHGFIDLAGDIVVLGPHPGGRAWQVGIRHPRENEKTIAHLPMDQGAIATSGDYERFMWVDGVRYCHIMDPGTGWPVRSFASVSVCADQCLVAGTASTIAMLKPPLEAKTWLDHLCLSYLIIDEDLKKITENS